MHQNLAAMNDEAMANDVAEHCSQRSPSGTYTIEITWTIVERVEVQHVEGDPNGAAEKASEAAWIPSAMTDEVVDLIKANVLSYSPDDPGDD